MRCARDSCGWNARGGVLELAAGPARFHEIWFRASDSFLTWPAALSRYAAVAPGGDSFRALGGMKLSA